MIRSFCKDIYKMLCKRYPNRKIYIIGDQHFYHKNIINYTRSNFSDVFSMNEYIIKLHNETVDKDDIVIFCGDFSFKNNYIKIILEKMNGHKYLILGNHDSEDLIKNYPNLGFEGVFKEPIKINNNYLSHEPLIDNERNDLNLQLILKEFKSCINGINYHGHIHTSDNDIENYKNVTCEALNYRPIMIGKTENLNNEKDLFINSSYFDKALTFLRDKHNLNPDLVISDYIYSSILENGCYQNKYFVQGSYGLLKKYNFLSKMSDLDISLIYDKSISKRKNIGLLKNMVDESYELLKQIDRINLKFLKRYPSLSIFEALYTSESSYFSYCCLDTNLVMFNCYKDNDFFKLSEISIIEKFLKKSSLSCEYKLPHFQNNFLIPEGDIANLLLQILFQKGNEEKKLLALKKLQYVYEHYLKNKNMENFDDIFKRFFLRNIYLLFTMNRYSEIEYIQNGYDISLLSHLPRDLKFRFFDTLDNYEFLDVYNEIASTSVPQVLNKSKEIIKKLN